MRNILISIILSLCLSDCALCSDPLSKLIDLRDYFPILFLPSFSDTTSFSGTTDKGKNIILSFSGDIMAHDVNFNMKNYNKIYDDVKEFLLSDGLSFGNIEMPVCDELPLSTYPRFNVHSDYLKAAIDAGFDIFSLANNHTNDQYEQGIHGTIASFQKLQKDFATKNRLLYASGVRQKSSDDMQPVFIEKNGFRILFLAVTEILNSYDMSKRLVYYSSIKDSKSLAKKIQKMREQMPCDLFVLSLHVDEKEYKRDVLPEKRERFKLFAKAGADIIWANHPHVVQGWEEFRIEEDLLIPSFKNHSSQDIHSSLQQKVKGPLKIRRRAFFMYSLGNFISGQRRNPNLHNPEYYREYTGDTVLMQLKIKKRNELGALKMEVHPILLTVHNGNDGIVIKQFKTEWMNSLPAIEQNYYKKRFELMKEDTEKEVSKL